MTTVEGLPMAKEASLMLVIELPPCYKCMLGGTPITSLFTVEIQLVGGTKVNDRKICVPQWSGGQR